MNSFGNLFRLTSFGESHGAGIGGVIDGCPAGIELDMTFIQNELNRRKPGQSKITTPRKEADEVTFLSGVFEGKTTGTPIGFIIWNDNQHSADYDNMKEVFRPWTFICPRNHSALCGWSRCQTCIKTGRCKYPGIHFASGSFKTG
jgi:chorismate synthase